MPTAFPSVSPGPQTLSLISSPNHPGMNSQEFSGDRVVAMDESCTSHNCSADVAQDNHSGSVYHRIAEIRQQQGLSLRTISRRTGLDIKELRRQEDPQTNLTLGQIRIWQKALEVPLVDLLEDDSDVLSRPVKERAQMVRIMKTVVSLGEVCESNVRLTRLTTMLREQILHLMPELAEIGGWPQCGSRRGADVMGRIFHDPISVEFDGD